jgi:hypothetical protein
LATQKSLSSASHSSLISAPFGVVPRMPARAPANSTSSVGASVVSVGASVVSVGASVVSGAAVSAGALVVVSDESSPPHAAATSARPTISAPIRRTRVFCMWLFSP